jgi:hypothetical protein
MQTKVIYLITLVTLITCSSYGQTTDPKAAKSKATVKKAVANKPTTPPAEVIPKTVDLDKESTYERIIDKGFESPDLLKKVADKRFFNNDFVLAARWYGCLFDLTTDLEPVYYYRYSVCLKETNQEEKAKHMMELFKKSSAKE